MHRLVAALVVGLCLVAHFSDASSSQYHSYAVRGPRGGSHHLEFASEETATRLFSLEKLSPIFFFLGRFGLPRLSNYAFQLTNTNEMRS